MNILDPLPSSLGLDPKRGWIIGRTWYLYCTLYHECILVPGILYHTLQVASRESRVASTQGNKLRIGFICDCKLRAARPLSCPVSMVCTDVLKEIYYRSIALSLVLTVGFNIRYTLP
jgi:hypothetical protein